MGLLDKKFYLFDFDGVLVDSMTYWGKSVLNVLDKAGVSYPDDIVLTLATLGNEGCVKYFREKMGITFTREEILKMIEEYAYPLYCNQILLKPYVLDALTAFNSAGHVLNTLTASPHKTLDPCLKRNGAYNLFTNVWSTDDYNLPKSDPQIFINVCKNLGCKPEDVLFFDDNLTALKTAKLAGLNTIGVYDSSSLLFKDEIIKTADKFIYGFNELL